MLLTVSNMFLQHRLPITGLRGVKLLWSLLEAGEATCSRKVLQGHHFGVSETPWEVTRLRCITQPTLGMVRPGTRLLIYNVN